MGTSRSSAALGPWAAAAALPVAFGPWLRSQYLLPKMAVAAFFLAWGWAWLAFHPRLLPVRSRIDGAVAAFCAAAFLSSLFSSDPRLSWFGHDGEYLFGMAGMAACVAAFYLGCALDQAGRSAQVMRWIAAGSLPVSAYAALQALGWRPYAWDGILPKGRVVSTLGSPIALGAYLALAIPVGIHLCRRRDWKGLGAACLALGVPALAMTGSRGAWAGAAFGAVVGFALEHEGGFWIGKRRRWAAVAALAAVFFSAALANRLRVGTMGGDGARWEMWRIAWQEAKDHPWMGSGVDTYVIGFRRHKSPAMARIYSRIGVQSHAHDDWMQVFATMGLVGLASYVWLHARVLQQAWPRVRGDSQAGAMAAGVAAVAVAAKFNSPSFAVAWLASCMAGCVLARPASVARLDSWSGLLSAAVFLLASGWFFWATAHLVIADRKDLLGRKLRAAGRPRAAIENFLGAVAWNPGTIQYRFDLANALWDAAQGARDPSGRRLLLLAAAQEAEEGVRLRPRDAEALRLLGVAQLRRAQWGGEPTLGSARRALDAALALDPYYGYTLEDLRSVAFLQKDEATRRELDRRLEMIK